MDFKLFPVVTCIFLAVLQSAESKKFKLVAYWGQNSVYNIHREQSRWEKDLEYFCKSYSYDVIVLAHNHIFFDPKNKDNMPGLNFGYHCQESMGPDYHSLLSCPEIETGISECHSRGKKVLLSLGGANGRYGFKNDAEAKIYARTVWDLFLGGAGKPKLRPFGSAVLDGIDLDIEAGRSTGYTSFVKELRLHMNNDASKKYLISAAPECPFPNGFLGPAPGKAFSDVGFEFDEIHVKFYNYACNTGNPRVFYSNVAKWLKFSSDTHPSGPKVFIGVPAKIGASRNPAEYRALNEVRTIFQRMVKEPQFGGFMLWDAGYDQNNIINGETYSENLVTIMNAGTPRPTKPSSVSCIGLDNGKYAHPTSCSKYFVCDGGDALVQSCLFGTEWNDVMKYCDWPLSAMCSS